MSFFPKVSVVDVGQSFLTLMFRWDGRFVAALALV